MRFWGRKNNMAERILVVKCDGHCRYLRVNQDPFDDSVGWYCAYNPHSAWEQITEQDCKKCQREGRFNGLPREEIIHAIAQTLKGQTSGDCVETAEYVLDTLMEMGKE
jgi:hypothetical protein